MATDTLKHLRGLLERERQRGAGQLITGEHLLRKVAESWIDIGLRGTGLRGDGFVVSHKEAIQGIYEYCGKTILDYLNYSRKDDAILAALHNAAPALLACAEALQNSLRYIDHAPECDFERTDNPYGDFCSCQYSKIRKESVAALDQLRKVQP